ncbi:MAG: LLM class flavin-dependent oxidoreductase [SAR202 cluster bacterium]|nr:LLM class flavin-dependent oxidoreductase [SAR202 cluster bacterium]|tara:strand:+ start:2327 stop:3328 length:1002 start_codon:yes stop_codon:yes gene_type:complete
MEFGVQVNCYETDWAAISKTILAMENGQWSSLWFADHFLPPHALSSKTNQSEAESESAFEGFTILAVAAGMTKRLRLGHLVLGNSYRNPGLVAKMATTLDQASGGRFTLSLGASWYEREHLAYGWPFPSMKERSDRFEEACELIRLLFKSNEPVNYEGEYYQLDQAPMSPGCYQIPHIPILVGGTGEKRTLLTLAKYGDVFNLDGWSGRGMSMDLYKHKIEVLEKHCEKVGRNLDEIKKTLLMPIKITDDEKEAKDFVVKLGYRSSDPTHGNYGGELVGAEQSGSVAGNLNYVIERIEEFAKEGVEEIMFGGIETGDTDTLQMIDEQIVSRFT